MSNRIIFMGTPEFAVPCLEAMIQHFNVVAVVTAPDKPKGRGLQLVSSPVKIAAMAHNIPVLQPEKLRDEQFLHELKNYQADVQVVVAFRMLPEVVWAMPPKGSINLHASLLPDYRGAAPINWAIINGEKETGLTTFQLQQAIDTGHVLEQVKIKIDEHDSAGTLHDKMKIAGADLLVSSVKKIVEGIATFHQQPSTTQVKVAPKIFKETCKIDWKREANGIRNFVRGLSPYPAAWTLIGEQTFKILSCSVTDKKCETNSPEFLTDNKKYFWIKTVDYYVAITEWQPEGKRKMSVEEFFRGNKLTV